ncbi:MAG: SAM-dependent methyltransferase [Clostridia bacterium]|nr:SAM-dependent methyltransferase [Clostridia bacterium]
MLDERLSLVAAMYQPCEWGADVGTDHAYLPRHLLYTGVCQKMIAADVSESALANARATLTRARMTDRVVFRLADGLDALDRPCGCVSITGMGGDTMAALLRRGADRLQGAVLVLSAHTELHMVRRAIMDIGYHFVREELCRAAGRFYVCWRAEPGHVTLTDDECSYGSLLWQTASPLLQPYAAWRLKVATRRLSGLLAAAQPDEAAIAAVSQEVAFYRIRSEVQGC